MKHTFETMIRSLGWVLLMAFSFVTARAECTGPYLIWSTETASIAVAYSAATDTFGNVYITGNFNNTVDFGGISLTSAGNTDIFICKYSSAGVLQWAVRAGSTGIDIGRGIAVDAAGNVYATGTFQGSIQFGPALLTAVGAVDMFVVKLDTSGVHQFSTRYGPTTGTSSIQPNAIAADASGTFAIAGEFGGTINLGGSNHVSAGFDDIFVARYLTGGTFQWSKSFGNLDDDIGWGVAVDSGNNTIITGMFQFNVNFGGATLAGSSTSTMFLAKYNSAGTHLFSQKYGSVSDGLAVAVDAASNMIVAGDYVGGINFGGANLTHGDQTVQPCLAKFNSSGVHVWSTNFNGSGSALETVAVDAAGAVLLGGKVYNAGTIDLGGGVLTGNSPNSDYFGKLDANGAYQWSTMLGITNEPFVVVDPARNVIVTGGKGGSSGGVFLKKFGPDTVQPCIGSIVDVGNDQGRNVKISFFKSGYDHSGAPAPVVRYDAYRRDDPLPGLFATSDAMSPSQLSALGWQFVGSVPAHGESQYLLGAPTVIDSTLNGTHYSAFFIRAATASPAVFYDSEIDSGYSVDNLSPSVPSNFVFSAGALAWDRSSAHDFDHYSVYGANVDAFASSALLARTVTPALDVSARSYEFYFVTASDASGNESKPARVRAASATAAARTYALAVSCYPNPFNPRTTVSYTIPSRGHVSVRVFDAHGALVTTLFDGERAAGAYSVGWDGRAENGDAVASSVYFVRIEANGATRVKKMVLLK